METRKITTKIENFKKISHLEAEFEFGNLYFIKGGNKKGKTSYGQAILATLNALSKTPDTITWGEEEVEVVVEFTGADNLNYIARYSKELGKDEKFVLMLPDGRKERKITEIRKIIGYNQITVDEWFRLGLTADGRRKQAEYIMELIPAESKAKIAKIDDEINSKTGIAYLRRQAKTKELEASQGVLKRLAISEEEIESLSKLKDYQSGLEKLEKELLQAENNNSKISLITQQNEKLVKEKERVNKEVTDTEAEIKRLQDKLVLLKAEQTELNNQKIEEVTVIDTTQLKERIAKGKVIVERLTDIQKKQQTIKTESANAQKLSIEVDELNKKIEMLREEKKQIISEANISERIMLDTDGCYFISDNGVPLPFNEESISYAEGGLEIAKIILEKNKNLPLVVLGKASEYDEASIEKLQQLAIKYNGVIIADKVVPQGEFSIEIYQKQ